MQIANNLKPKSQLGFQNYQTGFEVRRAIKKTTPQDSLLKQNPWFKHRGEINRLYCVHLTELLFRTSKYMGFQGGIYGDLLFNCFVCVAESKL